MRRIYCMRRATALSMIQLLTVQILKLYGIRIYRQDADYTLIS